MKNCLLSHHSVIWNSLALLFLLALPTTTTTTITVEAFAAPFVRPSSTANPASLLQRAAPRTPSTTNARVALQLVPMDHAYAHAHALAQTLQSTVFHLAAGAGQTQPLLSIPPLPPFLIQAWDTYSRLLQEQPVRTKAATAATLCFLGDAVAQLKATSDNNNNNNSDNNNNNYSIRRGLAFLLFGALYTGAFQHHWFQFLQTHVADWGEYFHIWGHPAATDIPVQSFLEQHGNEWWEYFDLKRDIDLIMDTLQDPPSPFELAAAKVALNQFLVIPMVYMPLFFLVTGAVAGLDWNKMQARAQSLYVPLLQRNYLFWLPIQTVQFWIVPTDYQVPFVCVASLCWTVVLSSIGGSAAPSASPSSIVAYQVVEAEQPLPDEAQGAASSDPQTQPPEPVYQVLSVDAGAANEITDEVLWEDVRDAVVPKDVRDAVGDVQEALTNNPRVGAGAGGLALGLLASAADEAAIGATLGSALGASEDLGIAVMAAVGAGAGYLVSQAVKSGDQTEGDSDDKSATGVDGDDDAKELTVTIVESETQRVDLEVNHTNSTRAASAPTEEIFDGSVHEQHKQSDNADLIVEDRVGASWEQNEERETQSNVLLDHLKTSSRQ